MAKQTAYNNIAGLNKALKRLPLVAQAHLRDAAKAIATDVAAEARGRASRVGGVAQYVAPTIKASRDRVPVIKMGGAGRLPPHSNSKHLRSGGRQLVGDIIWGAEFGGSKRVKTSRTEGGTTQFNPWRGNSKGAGYFLWPAVRANSDDIMDRYSQALADALRDF